MDPRPLAFGRTDPPPLPGLREDLALLEGGKDRQGRPRWLIHDPARNRYFQVSWEVARILQSWRPGAPPEETASRAAAAGPMRPRIEDIQAIAQFLDDNQLITRPGPEARDRSRVFRSAGHAVHWTRWILHHYLFFRIPLVHPDRILNHALRWARPLGHPAFLVFLALVGGLGMFLAGRQWADFTHTFISFLDWRGMALYALALALVKTGHELGHALVAKAKGCKVPTMGVAFLVLVPVLYTDVTDSWRLTRRRDRLAVVAAGMSVELGVALVATLAWALLPDGDARNAAYFLAAVSWVMSLAINASPFMRFDGYYLLSDALGEPNLQQRGFAMARWWWREKLWALGNEPPEVQPAGRRAILVAWALGAMVYRFFLFLGIALLVYHVTFKALGILLFLVEIWWFILRPILGEVAFWWSRRRDLVRRTRGWATLALVPLTLMALVLPWRSTVHLPAVLEPAHRVALRAPEPARVERVLVAEGGAVEAGTQVLILSSPDLERDMAETQAEIRRLEVISKHRLGDPETRARAQSLIQDLARAKARMDGLRKRGDALTITAPRAGVARDLPPGLAPGLWVSPQGTLLTLVDATRGRVLVHATERDAPRLRPKAEGRFIPDDGGPTVTVSLDTISTVASVELDSPLLSSTNGGRIPAHPPESEEAPFHAETAHFRGTAFTVDGAPPSNRVMSGEVVFESPSYAPLADTLAHAATVLVRESGF